MLWPGRISALTDLSRRNNRIKRWRRTIQLLALTVLFAIPYINLQGWRWVGGTFYSMHIGSMQIADPALVVQAILLTGAVSGGMLLAGFFAFAGALVLGKVFCAWVCPFNFLAEGMQKLRGRFWNDSAGRRPVNPPKRNFWYLPAAIALLTLLTGMPLLTLVSFPGSVSAQAGDWIWYGGVGTEGVFVAAMLVAELVSGERWWCKYVCPSGAMLALAKSPIALHLTYQPRVCGNRCPRLESGVTLCGGACPLGLDPRKKGIYPYCHNCGDCVGACRLAGQSALSMKYRSIKKSKIDNEEDEL